MTRSSTIASAPRRQAESPDCTRSGPEAMPDRTFQSADPAEFYSAITAQIAEAPTAYSLLKLMKEIAAFFRWHQFIVLRLPDSGEESLSQLTLLTNWKPELSRAYDEHMLIRGSPILSRLRTTTVPLSYDLRALNANRKECVRVRAVELFEKFGHHNGIYIPTVTPEGQRGAIGFSGRREAMATDEKAGLAYLSTQIFERIAQLNKSTETALNLPRLTEKELECIRLTAAGTTSAAAAKLLGTTANTVNHHLASASDKLGTLNKTHTVARSLRLGLID